MKALVRWRLEGETLVDCNSLSQGNDYVAELVASMGMPNFYEHETAYESPDILAANIVGPS